MESDVLNATDWLYLDLTHSEVHAMVYIGSQYADGEAKFSADNLARVIRVHRVTATNIVKSLVAKGVLTKVRMGVYTIHSVNPDVAPVLQTTTAKVAPAQQMSTESSVPASNECSASASICIPYKPISLKPMNVGVVPEPKGSSTTPGAAPRSKHTPDLEKSVVIKYDEPDGLAAIGLTQPRMIRSTPESRRRSKAHRLMPHAEWTPAIVAKEFGLRIYQARPELLATTDRVRLGNALRAWRKDHGVTVAQMITVMDQFFAEEGIIAGLTETPPAVNVFLKFMQNNFQHIKASDFDDAWLESVSGQRAELEALLRG